MAQTITARAVGLASSTAGASKPVAIPSGYAAGDHATLFAFCSTTGPPDNPAGWAVRATGNIGTGVFYGLWTKKLVAGDISAGTVTVNVPTLGKASLALLGHQSDSGDVALLAHTIRNETVATGTHDVTAVQVPGPGTVVSILGVKDTTTSVSANRAPPGGMPADVETQSTGVSQTSVAVSQTAVNDAPAGAFGTGLAWTVTQADGTTPATTINAVTLMLAYAAVLRPSGDVTLPGGQTFVGGSTLEQVAEDDDPATWMEYGGTGVTWEERVAVDATDDLVPGFIQVDMTSTGGAASSSVHAYLMLGATQLLDLGTVSTLIPAGGTSLVFSTSDLTAGQKASIIADPTNLRVRVVSTVA